MFNDRNFYGELYVVNGNVLSKYAKNKLVLTSNWGFAKIIEEKLDKVIIDVYYLQFSYYGYDVNHVSWEIVEKKDLCFLDWNMVKYMYNMGVQYIVEDYLKYVELFVCTKFGWFKDSIYGIVNFPLSYKTSKDAIKTYCSHHELHSEGTAWMVDQIESGKIDINEHINNLKSKYKIK